MIYEEALARFQAFGCEKYSDMEDRILEALEKQIPKKPNKMNRGTTTVHSGLCVNCLNTVFSYSHYCDVCGQAILWEE